jgi:hypothetical protein
MLRNPRHSEFRNIRQAVPKDRTRKYLTMGGGVASSGPASSAFWSVLGQAPFRRVTIASGVRSWATTGSAMPAAMSTASWRSPASRARPPFSCTATVITCLSSDSRRARKLIRSRMASMSCLSIARAKL